MQCVPHLARDAGELYVFQRTPSSVDVRANEPIDPDWFHRARTALRHLSRERAELLAQGTGRRRREKLKDALIGILRERHDPETWEAILAEAQARSEREGL